MAENTHLGGGTLQANTTGNYDTAVGFNALNNNQTGSFNTALGANTLSSNVNGSQNTAAGFNALFTNTAGNNTAYGFNCLEANNSGSSNTASGSFAMQVNVGGSQNTAHGCEALTNNTSGNYNTAVGFQAMPDNNSGSNNTAIGADALAQNTTGSNNIAIGYQASMDVGMGNFSNNIHIGSVGVANDANSIRIGTPGTQNSCYLAGARGVTTSLADAVPVVIDSQGQLGTVNSSRRFKEDIQDMGEASCNLMRLRPVSFRYEEAFAGGAKPIHYGLIAEEVDEVYPELVARSADGQVESVKYQLLPSMLLNELQRMHKVVLELSAKLLVLQDRLSTRGKEPV
jgi:hypothetical protein